MGVAAPSRIVAGNWKMNLDREAGVKLAAEVAEGTRNAGIDIVLAPPFVLLPYVAEAIAGAGHVALAAQNCHHESAGAFTGEVSASMLASVGCSYVITGHSERRSHFAESDGRVGEKVRQALSCGLRPIFCCGEKEDERDSGRHLERVKQQVSAALSGLDAAQAGSIVIAYEPVWAIGTGRNAGPEQAMEMHRYIRELWTAMYGAEAAATLPILYGGSCNAGNAAALFAQPGVNGGLIGGASLKAADFIAIVNAFPR